MSSPIDPVTGLPMVGVPDVVSQIPLGVQVVPWDDIKAVDRPQGGPSYPNDIINTFAWIEGEQIDNRGVIRAGTMTSDRRLRVDTGASSGASPIPAGHSSSGDGAVLSTTAEQVLLGCAAYPNLVYYITVWGYVDGLPSAYKNARVEWFILGQDNADPILYLPTFPLVCDHTGLGHTAESVTMIFPNGLDIWGTATTSRQADIWGSFFGTFDGTIVGSAVCHTG